IAQPLIELRGDEAFTAPVDSRNSDQCRTSVRRRCSGADDRLHQLAQAGHFAGVSHPPVAWIGPSASVVIQAAIAPGFSWLLFGNDTEPVQRLPSLSMSIFANCSATKSWRNFRPLFSPRFTSDSRSAPSNATFSCTRFSDEFSGSNMATSSV